MIRARHRVVATLVFLSLSNCGDSSPDPVGSEVTDAAIAETASDDAGTEDSSAVDSSAVDSGAADSGSGMDAASDAMTGPPSKPPAAICDSASLAGPTTAPAGAVVVNVGTDLSALVAGKPAGTTFYLAAGVHMLAKGEFNQVVPKDDDTFIGAPGAILDGQHSNLYAFTQHAKHVTLSHFTIQNFGTPGSTNNEGTVNHDAGDGWVIESMTIQQNSGAGLFIGSNNVVRDSCLRNNGQYGFSAYSDTGINNVTLDHNEISGNNTDDWEKRMPGCGCTGGGKFWATKDATVTNNWVHDNKSVGLWADTNNVGFDFSGNYISNNHGVGIFYEISYNARIAHNTLVRNGLVEGPSNPGFPTGAIYLSESGGDSRVGTKFTTLEVFDNVLEDNWSGVVLWENADRFCNSPANSSTGVCALGGAATLKSCVKGTIEKAPYLSDCRWKTQNVSVHDNVFRLDPAKVGAKCTAANGCGFQAVFSNYGTFPDWSPYKGDTVEKAITLGQANVFSKNTYVGPWRFLAKDQGTQLTFAQWQAAPYGQDVGSVSK